MRRLRILQMLLLSTWAADATEVYRCVDARGRPAYTSLPSAFSGCVPARIDVAEPSAEEAARALEQQERARAQDLEEEQQKREERELKARERAAEAAARQARAAEEAARQRESGLYQPAVPWGYYPYWGFGRGVVVPPHHHHRPDFGKDFKRDRGNPPRSGDRGMKSGPHPKR